MNAAHGFPGEELVNVSKEADMVLGLRGAGGFTRMLLVSTAGLGRSARAAGCHRLAGEPRLAVGLPGHVLRRPPRGGLGGMTDAEL